MTTNPILPEFNKVLWLTDQTLNMVEHGEQISFIPLAQPHIVHYNRKTDTFLNEDDKHPSHVEDYIVFNALVHNRSEGLASKGIDWRTTRHGISEYQLYGWRVTAIIMHQQDFRLIHGAAHLKFNPEGCWHEGHKVTVGERQLEHPYVTTLTFDKSLGGEASINYDTHICYEMKRGAWLQYLKTPYHFWRRQLGL
ncbi:hypothetical protein GR11A_00233 [Vibrio phage vB_VcorM_GR11A]|nr:hypothetical protein GR11A_00233 [Vibrio phage vB_VcorM_GR11A]